MARLLKFCLKTLQVNKPTKCTLVDLTSLPLLYLANLSSQAGKQYIKAIDNIFYFYVRMALKALYKT